VRDEETGEPSYFVAIIEDIGARKAAEEALSESEEFNRRIVESSSDCIKILDLRGGCSTSARGAGAARDRRHRPLHQQLVD
jgi:PAS domain-containing protein